MALIQWQDDLSVNIARIDKEHKKLVEMINALNTAMREGKGKAVIGKIVDNMAAYTQIHFQTEEKYFDEFDYPDAAPHKKEHSAFIKKVSEFKGRFSRGEITLTIEVMDFLSKWLENHIKGVDKKYGPFLNAKGAA